MNKELSLQDFRIWLAKAEEILSKTHYAFVYLTIFGLRRGEVCGLRSMDVTFNTDGRAILRIRDSRSSRTRNGAGRTKTESSVRYVSLDETGSSLLKHAIKEAKTVKKITGTILKPEKDYITISIKNGKLKLEPPSFMNKIFKLVSNEVKIHVTPHIMRHFFTTQALIAGVNQYDIMRYVGHTQTRTTSAYTHIRDERTQLVTDAYIDSIREA
ncbi:tyrosine-type recombinase/integrase [Streptococcus sp. ZJ93]|uniref:tyrosine-type recombinase/integrase n=1 Tax=Streptococcus handemini TaxID=3161188 RepID=UPI0032EFE60E